ncbi:cisplatin damage response ATP-dependent DNA ligase [Betaproteobacteria bacterium]|nr:cisplatin damage response ATP-dependent DNA ligase [Betaproteobacteria bacterium]
MIQFVKLIRSLDQALGNLEKKNCIKEYFQNALLLENENTTKNLNKSQDQWLSLFWAIYFLSGEKLNRIFSSKILKMYTIRKTNMPQWLFDECYDSVGDLAETIAHLVWEKKGINDDLSTSLHQKIQSFMQIKSADDEKKLNVLTKDFEDKSFYYIFTVCKMFTGGFRIGVSRLQVTQVISEICGVDKELIASRLIVFFKQNYANIEAVKYLFSELLPVEQRSVKLAKSAAIPFPFYLSQNLSDQMRDEFFRSYRPEDWTIEWKWDGIRMQLLVKINTETQKKDIQLWTRGEEFVSENFPGLIEATDKCIKEDVVLDGELLVWDFNENKPKKFSSIQKLLGKKKPKLESKNDNSFDKVIFMAYDILSLKSQDLRSITLKNRKTILKELFKKHLTEQEFMLSPIFVNLSPIEIDKMRKSARQNNAEGVMLKRMNGQYGVGRKKGKTGYDSFKWKMNPLSVDAVIIYAQKGHGIRSGIFSDYTFAIFNDEKDTEELVPFAKAYSGLSNADMKLIDSKIKKITEESYGPVKKVRPEIIVELLFDSISESKRHKSGIAVRFPRMKRIRFDKNLNDIDRLSSLKKLI